MSCLLRLAPTLRKKAHNYKERGMDLGELDIIAFASLKREVLDLNSHFPPPTEYLRQGWRSLSLVGPTFARVLFAHPDAPDFLRSNLGRSVVFDVWDQPVMARNHGRTVTKAESFAGR
jgi:hypothetical protein